MRAKVTIFTEGPTPGSKGVEVACHRQLQTLVVDVTPVAANRYPWPVPEE